MLETALGISRRSSRRAPWMNPCCLVCCPAVMKITLLFFLLCSCAAAADDDCSAWLVESVPTHLPQLHRIPGLLSTGDVLQWLAGNASQSLDILAQYWQLLAQSSNPLSGDYGYSSQEMKQFGAHVGKAVYELLDAAAERGVSMRIIQHSGLPPDFDEESAALAASRDNVKNITLIMEEWWGSGIVHAKVWIADKKDLYIGSANNDWKSLTQVKELGIYITNCPAVAKKMELYFENIWTLAFLNSSEYTTMAWDDQFQLFRKVPCWSHIVPSDQHCSSPLPKAMETISVVGFPHPATHVRDRRKVHVSDTWYLSFAPPEVSLQDYQTDEQGWVDTILSANINGTVRINTMDWLGQSQFSTSTVSWSALSDAIAKVVFAKHVTVKLLVAYWTHTPTGTNQYLTALNYTNILCSSSGYNKCSGKVEIKYFKVPGFNSTGPKVVNGSETGNKYPGYTRVNHAKYVVSDKRAHIGTSNLVWDYFYTTAGISFGTYSNAIISQLQHVFDVDWESPYATAFDSNS